MTYEELKSMSTEELVRYAQELQESLETEKKHKQNIYESYRELETEYKTVRESISNILKLTEREKIPY